MGYAIAVMGLSVADFMALTPAEYSAAVRAWETVENGRQQMEWERTRMLATITVQPHTKKRLTPRKLLPLPWDDEAPEKPQAAPPMSRDEARARFLKLSANK